MKSGPVRKNQISAALEVSTANQFFAHDGSFIEVKQASKK